ncbi:MAG: EAL domain-containing protein [Sediminimonas qiaohouensis]|uniref:EAL domain-containing protein n=1 Tax=Sediminimonas qiaohouensis TaxID=552061 RepID=A0A7C9LBG1_9RHOB|nr:EAL domain-containing protein [Sediminimonas qiaohouensis]MTJ05158.1 EAL domain-containing protein [Sediminimonas qiaohouensis]
MSEFTLTPFLKFPANFALAIWLGVLTMAIWVGRQPRFPGRLFFLSALAGVLFWLGAAALEIAANTLAEKVFWAKVAWPCIALTATAWALFLKDYSFGKDTTHDRWPQAALVIGPAVVSALIFTNPWHGLFYGSGTRLETFDGRFSVVYDHGPLFYLAALYLYAFMGTAFGVVIYCLFQTHPSYRASFISLAITTAVPIAANIAYIVFNVTLFGFDPTPFTFAIWLAVMGRIVLSGQVFNIGGIGREALFLDTDNPMVVFDANGCIISANPAAEDVLNGGDKAVGINIRAWPQIGFVAHEILETGTLPEMGELTCQGRSFDIDVTPIYRPMGRGSAVMGWAVQLNDTTARKQAEAEQARAAQLGRMLEESLNEVYVFDAQTLHFTEVNRGARANLGYGLHELTAMTPVDINPDLSRDMFELLIAPLRECREEIVTFQTRHRRKDGSHYPVDVRIQKVDNNDSHVLFAMMWDITLRKAFEEKLELAATHDDLTGLLNRSAFNETLSQRLEKLTDQEGSLALVSLDIDNFKDINDALGDAYGDTLLAAVGERLRGVVRDGDMLFRMGGDEFIILVPDSTADDANSLADHLVKAFIEPFNLMEVPTVITVSIGVVLAPEDGNRVEELRSNANLAMTSAKNDGRNTVSRFAPWMRQHLCWRNTIVQDLQRSLHEGEGFKLLYQPKFTCDTTRKVVGAEALLRWQGENAGSIGPDEFIPIAEHAGLIRQIDYLVIDRVAKQLGDWVRDGMALPVSINISAISIQTEGFADHLLQRLEAHGVSCELFQVEIVETVHLEESLITQQNLATLSKAGICILIDDFGTGHSSLNYLRRLPIQALKMDRSFVAGIGLELNSDDTLAQAIIAMANTLRLDVIAEGVETEAQFRWLAQKSCTQVQGFLTSRPLKPETFAERYLARIPQVVF